MTPAADGGILARRDIDGDVMQEHGINPIDMVVVNLYPFEATVAKENCSLEDAVENDARNDECIPTGL